jgi:hypothetical protein
MDVKQICHKNEPMSEITGHIHALKAKIDEIIKIG